MRVVALLVWVFLNIVFLIMCCYIYLIWYSTRSRNVVEIYTPKTYDPKDPVIFYETANNSQTNVKNKKRFVDVAERHRSQPRIRLGGTAEREGKTRLDVVKDEVLLQLRRTMHDESSVFRADNPYGVKYNGPRFTPAQKTPTQMRCALKHAGLRTLTKEDLEPIAGWLGDGSFIPKGQVYNNCAVVSSAASLLYSSSGSSIDNHDLVIRFNHAPTEDYELDVGSKTHIRVLNSQVVTKEEFKFTTNPIFKNITIVVWDPSQYGGSLQDWFNKPDFNFFESWIAYRKANPGTKSAVLDPRSVWRVWNFLQSMTSLRIRRNPPSTGFLGLSLVLPICNYVDFYEYVPSERMTSMCHYYDDLEDSSCTLGVWHPLAAEKLIALEMNTATDDVVFERGFIRIPGFQNLNC